MNAGFHIRQAALRVAISKHSRAPGTGRCRIVENSSLRKLMRAANRSLVPVERIRVIVDAQKSAAARPEAWLSSHQRIARAKAALEAKGFEVVPPKQPEPTIMPTKEFPTLATSTESPSILARVVAPTAAPQQSKVYSVKSNAARAAVKHGLTRADVFEVVGGYAFSLPA